MATAVLLPQYNNFFSQEFAGYTNNQDFTMPSYRHHQRQSSASVHQKQAGHPQPADIQTIVKGLSQTDRDAILAYQPNQSTYQISVEDEKVLLALQQQLKQQQQQVVSPSNKKAHNHGHGHGKQVLPCFNMICTGTCAYGMKCTFLHDPRAQIPKHCRKQVEFTLQSHLHTYRPYANSKKQYNKGQTQDLDSSCSSTDSECNSVGSGSGSGSNNGSKGLYYSKSQGFKRDDIFDFPFVELAALDANSKCYDPVSTTTGSETATNEQHWRELCMWYHLLAAVNTEKVGLERIPMLSQACQNKKKTSRLSVFEQLSQSNSPVDEQKSNLW